MEAPFLLLASASPRRRRLLTWLGAPFDVTATDTDEDLSSPLRGVPPVLARSLAADKARAARQAGAEDQVVLAFDTIVLLDREVLGKPADLADAFRMLGALSGRTHQVITGVAVQLPGWDEPRTFAVTTPVLMHDIDADAMQAWADRGELMGCAGAYNIESHLASVGEDECFQNVAGLPLCHLYVELSRQGVKGLEPPCAACEQARGVECALGRDLVARVMPTR